MKWLIDDLYELIEFDKDYFDFFDLYYLLKYPNKIRFYYNDKLQELESVEEDGACSVCFNGKWYRDRDGFFKDASVDGVKLTSLYGFEVI